MFRKIAFTSGMPMIVVDLMIYLCGGYNEAFVVQSCRKAVDLLQDRVAPVIIRRPKGSITGN